jgi:hypothetical protein
VKRTKPRRTVTVAQPAPKAREWVRRREGFWSGSLERLTSYAENKETEAWGEVLGLFSKPL